MFDNIIIIGQGKVAKQCKNIAENFFQKEVILISNNTNQENDEFFNSVRNSFIISANNFYIFKNECIKYNTIINYHNALLPKHKGCNAHVWSIWENDEKSGITWHKVDTGVDTGKIILQKEIILDDTMTAIKLLQIQSNLAINSLNECLKNINNDFSQENNNYAYHKKCDLPNNGILDLKWDKLTISRFLRAMDNGNLTPKAKVIIENKEIEIMFYQITNDNIKITLYNDKILEI